MKEVVRQLITQPSNRVSTPSMPELPGMHGERTWEPAGGELHGVVEVSVPKLALFPELHTSVT